ncbi:MAG: M28 family metallopeptidase [Clostridium sp.]|uniref:M28 family metallopeptidase n=1 Tax=Clostridium sp. TaxID=1506 RepID=UPI002FCB2378
MKKHFVFKIILPTILTCAYLAIVYLHPYFNTISFMDNIKTLSSPEYKGRLTGDTGAEKAAKYIESEFNSIGLTPMGDNKTYIQKFKLNNVQLNGTCSFKAYDARGNLLKIYKYGIDYKEIGFGKCTSGTVKGQISSKISTKPPIYMFKEEMVTEIDDIYKLDDVLIGHSIKAAIYTTESQFDFRTPYKLQKTYGGGINKIMVNKDVSNEIETLSKAGATFEITTNTDNKTVTGNNVIGMIKGRNSALPPLIISSHLDHVGYDSDGRIYPGALDNASGTSFVIEAARALSKSKPERNIVFACFDAEEVGLLGSQYFAKNPPLKLKGGKVINFDMVASTKEIPLSVLSNNENPLSKEILSIMSALGVKSNTLHMDNSDHASFDPFGIDSVTLIHDDVDKIHSPIDTIKNISENRIVDVHKTLKAYMVKHKIIKSNEFKVHTNIYTVEYLTRYIVLLLTLIFFLNILLFTKIYKSPKKHCK